jgi:indolepyruvate ferredoxin oxidoreductase beta subunit
MSKVTNITFAGIGGQGVLKGTDILAEVAFEAGFDVKKSEVHGMSQRGGSVSSEIRFGEKVGSPMVPEGESDFLVVMDETQIEVNRHKLKEGGILISVKDIDMEQVENKRTINIILCGLLSSYLDFSEEAWLKAVRKFLPAKVHELNERAFKTGRSLKK